MQERHSFQTAVAKMETEDILGGSHFTTLPPKYPKAYFSRLPARRLLYIQSLLCTAQDERMTIWQKWRLRYIGGQEVVVMDPSREGMVNIRNRLFRVCEGGI